MNESPPSASVFDEASLIEYSVPRPPRPRAYTIFVGMASAMQSALVTAILLLVNGSFVSVLLTSIANAAPTWLVKPGVLQFILFTVPLVMVVMQWIIWDVIRDLMFRDGNRD